MVSPSMVHPHLVWSTLYPSESAPPQDWHRFNAKQVARGNAPVAEAVFDALVDGQPSHVLLSVPHLPLSVPPYAAEYTVLCAEHITLHC